MKAVIRINKPVFNKQVWEQGCRNAGYTVTDNNVNPQPEDALFVWDFHYMDEIERYRQAGAKVFSVINGWFSERYWNHNWVAICLNSRDNYPLHLGEERRLKYKCNDLPDYRKTGTEILGLNQQHHCHARSWYGIPPEQWSIEDYCTRVRISHNCYPTRQHPVDLFLDMQNSKAVVTWTSTAAFKAMLVGIPVFYGHREWIGRHGLLHVDSMNNNTMENYPDRRINLLNHLFASMWTYDEIASGYALKQYLEL